MRYTIAEKIYINVFVGRQIHTYSPFIYFHREKHLGLYEYTPYSRDDLHISHVLFLVTV
jgi:hypothetical protein